MLVLVELVEVLVELVEVLVVLELELLEVDDEVLLEVLVVLELVEVLVDDVIAIPRQITPSNRIHRFVSVSKNSCPALGAVGTALCSKTLPDNLLKVVMYNPFYKYPY